jgi:Fe-S-cluster containining protein
MNDREIDRMAAFVDMSSEAFIDTHMTLTGDRRGLTLVEEDNGHCIFFECPALCKVYPVRPKQCRDFPNKWSFPGFRTECRCIAMRYKQTRPDTTACAAGYFPSKKLSKSP